MKCELNMCSVLVIVQLLLLLLFLNITSILLISCLFLFVLLYEISCGGNSGARFIVIFVKDPLCVIRHFRAVIQGL